MTDKNSDQSDGIKRRSVLKGAAAAGAIGLVGLPGFSGSALASMHEETYYLTQDGDTYEVTPITYYDGDGNMVPIAEFYNYAADPNLGGSNTPIGIEANNESRMFLYRDATGLYVVFLHDDYLEGGAVDRKDWQAYFEFDGLPADGSWVIDEGNDPTDDFGDADQFYWRWFPRWSDGGAYGLLACEPGSEFSITVHPDFNPNPDGETMDGPMSEEWLVEDGWQFVEWDSEVFETITLDESAQLTIACETCEECADGTELLEKYEWIEGDEYEERDGHFELEGDDDMYIDLVGFETDDDGEPIEACFDVGYCAVDVVVKAGREYEVYEDVSGEVCVSGIEYENPSGTSTMHAISNVRFFCDAPEDLRVGKGRGR